MAVPSFFLYSLAPHRGLHSFPTRRSSDLARGGADKHHERERRGDGRRHAALVGHHLEDRKSTRLNSSHRTISYAVFCLKKKRRRPQPYRGSLPPRRRSTGGSASRPLSRRT